MASWMVHFRIADNIMESLPELVYEPYIVGSIGPDCGEPNEDWSVFTPSSEITHWAPGGKKNQCDYEKFYKLILLPQKSITDELSKYNCGCKSHCNKDTINSSKSNDSNRNDLNNNNSYTNNSNNNNESTFNNNEHNYKDNLEEHDKLSFYIGYYIHLFTDVLWVNKIVKPNREKWNDKFLANENFIWEVKGDWYDLDHLYLKMNPKFRTFNIFKNIKNFNNIYLDYYPDQAFMKQITYISNFYLDEHNNLERDYIYLTEEEMNEFVNEATEIVIHDLKIKKIL